jgi:5-methylcytosine-specific restriction endonuclease McrA
VANGPTAEARVKSEGSSGPQGRKVLLLSRAYLPVRVISWQRAITLWVLEKIEVLETDPVQFLHSTRLRMPLPTVARLTEDRHARGAFGKARLSRLSVYTRDDYTCQYCGGSYVGDRKRLTIDHVVPRSRGGDTSWENVVTACQECNRKKGGKTPREAGMHLLSHPRRPGFLPEVLCVIRQMNRVPEEWGTYLDVFVKTA